MVPRAGPLGAGRRTGRRKRACYRRRYAGVCTFGRRTVISAPGRYTSRLACGVLIEESWSRPIRPDLIISIVWSIASGLSGAHRRPEYIRLIAQAIHRRLYGEPGIQRVSRHPGRVLRPTLRTGLPPRPDRGKPVAICRLKRVAADHRDDITALLPKAPREKNGRRVAVSAPVRHRSRSPTICCAGYAVTIFEQYAVPAD